jgi:hypothetical protein
VIRNSVNCQGAKVLPCAKVRGLGWCGHLGNNCQGGVGGVSSMCV